MGKLTSKKTILDERDARVRRCLQEDVLAFSALKALSRLLVWRCGIIYLRRKTPWDEDSLEASLNRCSRYTGWEPYLFERIGPTMTI